MTTRTLAQAGLVVTTAFLVSRLLGWLRLIVITATAPTATDLDAFFAAYRIPDLMFQLVAAGALGSALIPVVSGLLATAEEERAWRLVSSIANVMLLALLVLGLAFAIAAPVLVPAITPGFDAAATARTVELTRVMLLSPILLALGSVATSALNATGRFGASAVAPIVYNLAIIGAAVLLAPSMGVTGLAVGVVAGSLGHLLVQLGPLGRAGYRHRPIADLADPDTRRTLRLLAPRALGLAVSQVTFLVATTLASNLGTGAIAAFTVAFALLQLPIGVIGVPLGIVLLPSLSRGAALDDREEFLRLVTRSLRLLVFVMVPIAALGMVLGGEIVGLLFDYGAFGEAGAGLAAETLVLFLIGLPAHASIAILARAFYARQDTATPVAAAVLAVAINSSLAVVLVGPLGLPGLALAIAVAAWIEALVLVGLLARRVEGLELGGLLRTLLESTLASVAAAVAATGILGLVRPAAGPDPSKLVLLAEAVAGTAAGGLAFLAVALALRIPELPSIVSVVVDLVRRRGRS
ncbi:MAG TPA: murein biosynthesis integral membrane protein MurJ [Candidatus Limnocylindrales bacterium]